MYMIFNRGQQRFELHERQSETRLEGYRHLDAGSVSGLEEDAVGPCFNDHSRALLVVPRELSVLQTSCILHGGSAFPAQ